MCQVSSEMLQLNTIYKLEKQTWEDNIRGRREYSSQATDEDQASFNLAHVFQLSGNNWAWAKAIVGFMLTFVKSYQP